MTVQVLKTQRFDPPRRVEVESDGSWWPGRQASWVLCDDGRGWMGDVRYSVRTDWGTGQHVGWVRPERLRLVDDSADPVRQLPIA